MVHVLESAKNKPSPIDAYFGGVYYIGPLFTSFRGTPAAEEYYQMAADEVDQRVALGLGPVTPEGQLEDERFRLVVEGPPNWTALNALPSRQPPPISKIISRNVMPMGISTWFNLTFPRYSVKPPPPTCCAILVRPGCPCMPRANSCIRP